MKSKAILMMVFCAFSFSALAGLPAPQQQRRAPLAIEIRHSSIGTGIDVKTYKEVNLLLTLLTIHGKIDYVKTSGWGMEGESTQCVQFKDARFTSAAYAEMAPLVKGSRLTTAKIILDCDPSVKPEPNE